jgi:hypothetical protein
MKHAAGEGTPAAENLAPSSDRVYGRLAQTGTKVLRLGRTGSKQRSSLLAVAA